MNITIMKFIFIIFEGILALNDYNHMSLCKVDKVAELSTICIFIWL